MQQDDRVGPDVCAGLRRLRQAVVVCMLDAVPSVRSIMNADTVESSVIALGEPPDDLPCLRSSTVCFFSLNPLITTWPLVHREIVKY